MSTTTAVSSIISTSSAATTTSTTCATAYRIPTNEAGCGIPTSHNSTEILKNCCGTSPIIPIGDGCSSYCLQGQGSQDLVDCFYSNGVANGTVWCEHIVNTTTPSAAVSSGSPTATGTSASSSSTTGAAVPAAKLSTSGVGVIALMFCSALLAVIA